MSFLLSKNRSRLPSTQGINRSSMARAPGLGRPRGGGGGQSQQLIQRPRSTIQRGGVQHQQERRTQQHHDMKATVVQQERHTESSKVQGVISMEEVMEDLRVLEQQQRDSQRKLNSIKLAKQEKLQQRVSLENELTSLTFSNGEKRAQLVRCREVLSQCTGELGSVQQRTESWGDSLKDFDVGLKKGLAVCNALQAFRSKLDLKLKAASKAEDELIRLNDSGKEKVKATALKRDEVKRRQQLLRESIQSHRVRAKQLHEETAKLRSETCRFNQGLATSKELEASTKVRAEAIVEDLSRGNARHSNALKLVERQLESYDEIVTDVLSKKADTLRVTEESRKNLRDAWLRCVKVQREEGHDESPNSLDGASPPFLQISRIRSQLQVEEDRLLVEKKKNESLTTSIATRRNDLTRLAGEERVASQEIQMLTNRVDQTEKVENGRQQTQKDFQSNLDSVRAELSQLRRSKLESEKSFAQSNRKTTDKLLQYQQEVFRKKQVISEVKIQVSLETERAKQASEALKTPKAESVISVEATKQKAEVARSVIEQLEMEVEDLAAEMACETEEDIESYNRAQTILIEDRKSEIALLLEQCPSLSSVRVQYESSKTSDLLVQEALGDLRTDCESRVEIARKNREGRLRALQHSHEIQRIAKKNAPVKAERQNRKVETREPDASRRKEASSKGQRRSKPAYSLSVEQEPPIKVKHKEEGRRVRRSKPVEKKSASIGKSMMAEEAAAPQKFKKTKVGDSSSHVRRTGRVEHKKNRKRLDEEAEPLARLPKKRRTFSKDETTSKREAGLKNRREKSKSGEKNLSLIQERNDSTYDEHPADVETAHVGSQRRVTWGALDGATHDGAEFWGSDAGDLKFDNDAAQTTYGTNPGVLTQLSQDDPRNEPVQKTTVSKSKPRRADHDRVSIQRVRKQSKESAGKPVACSERTHKAKTPGGSGKARSHATSRPREPKEVSELRPDSSSKAGRRKSSSSRREPRSRKLSSESGSQTKRTQSVESHRESISTTSMATTSSKKDISGIKKFSDKRGSRQASGISSMERSSKSRRRKKAEGPPTKKKRVQSLGSMADDYDFHF